LTLDWPHEPSSAREDFLPAPGNIEALRWIDGWPDWSSPNLMLVGPAGSGKSHLGAIWARRTGARVLHGDSLAETALSDLASARTVLIEDADRVGGAEAALFHLINLMKEQGQFGLFTARASPDFWGVKTPDLLSRLRLAPLVRLGEPDEDLSRAVLFKLFSDRQLVVDASVINYVALRIERSLDAARAVVAALDREALARGKPITRAMAAQFLRDVSKP
jgi:chromosomal replication initiation ATPase DnaA